ncbi:MAG: hypothetical protein QM719_08390 [Thermomonas sp.]
MDTLTPFEKQVLDACLAGDSPVLCDLRQQAIGLTVSSREYTGPGAYINFAVSESSPLLEGRTIIIGDVNLEIKGLPSGVATLLYILDGKLNFLELATYDGDWPDQPEITGIGYLREIEISEDSFNLVPAPERHAPTLDRALQGRASQSAA